jgi:multicomponent K+:H+ antiporter subunit G
MNAALLPAWTALLIAALLVLAGCLVLIGAMGLLRLSSFYQRSHGTAMINTLGAGCVAAASMLYFSFASARLAPHELLIVLFLTMTSPVTAMLLMRAALFRERAARRHE